MLDKLFEWCLSVLFSLKTHPQNVAVSVNNFISFREMIHDVRLGTIVDSQVGLPDLKVLRMNNLIER